MILGNDDDNGCEIRFRRSQRKASSPLLVMRRGGVGPTELILSAITYKSLHFHIAVSYNLR